MNRSFRLTSITLFALMATLTGGLLHAQEVPVDCPLGGYIDEATGACSFSVEVDIAYPVWLAESEVAAETIGALLTAARDEFFSAMSWPLEEFYTGGFLGITFEEFEHGAALRSVVFTVSLYTGGAHPNSYFLSTTFDTIADRQLSLTDDIFIPGADVISVLQPLVVAELVAQQGDAADLEWIDSGTDELSDYVAWAIDAGTLKLFFAPYQVAAYAYGPSTVDIDVDDLAGVINPMLLP